MPGPLSVLAELGRLAGTSLFWGSVLRTLLRVLAGFGIGAVLGAALAALAAARPWLDRLLSPAVGIMRAVPVTSFILLLLLWMGADWVPGACAALMVLPVVWGNVQEGIRETDPLLLEAAVAYRFSPIKTVKLIYFPSVLPYFAAGCATGLGLAWKSGVAAEVISQPKWAMGLEMNKSKIYLETPALFAWTGVVILLSFLLEQLLVNLLRRVERGKRP